MLYKFFLLQDLERYVRTRLCICQSMMMIDQIVSTRSCNGLKLVIGQTATEMATRFSQSVVKLIIRIIHLVHSEYLFEATFIKRTVMRHKR